MGEAHYRSERGMVGDHRSFNLTNAGERSDPSQRAERSGGRVEDVAERSAAHPHP